MKTLLIPIDFTPTTDNAVVFGAEWCKRYEFKRVILLKTFYNNLFDHIVVSAEYAPVNQDYMKEEREQAKENLEELTNRLESLVGPGIAVSTALSEEPLLRAIMEIIEYESVDMIILGSNNYNYSSDSLVASSVISIARASPVRVLMVPVTYTFQPIDKALVPCNFNALEYLDKINSLRTSPLWADTKLLVLNVDSKERYLHPDDLFRQTEDDLHQYLKNFQHEIHYTNEKNIIDGIINFTRNNDVHLIIAMPGKYSFLYSLTHKNISEAIYLNANEPVLIMK
jgi:nucleotide-binding universal stress UspA family protein